MLEKATIATLIATFLAVGYSGVEDSIDEIFNEANVVTSVLQERELKTALEIYYTKYNSYPLSLNEEMIEELYDNECIEASKVPYDIEYAPSSSGQNYTLNFI